MAPDFTTSAKPRERLSLAGMVLPSHDAQEQVADVGTLSCSVLRSGRQPMGWCHPHPGWVLPLQLV